MNTRTYILSNDTLSAGPAGIDIFESGITNLTISLAGITGYYTKFIVDFDDGSDEAIIQHTTNIKLLNTLSISHVFSPTDSRVKTHNITLVGHRTDLTTDTYSLNFMVGKASVTDYKSLKIIDAQVFTTPDGKNNVKLTVESQNPRFVGNFIIPYDIDISDLTSIVLDETTLEVAVEGLFLRTEIMSRVGGLEAIITEGEQAYIIREKDLIIFVIGNEVVGSWSGQLFISEESITVHEAGGDAHVFATTDINGDSVIPELILVPEESAAGQKYEPTPSDHNLPYR